MTEKDISPAAPGPTAALGQKAHPPEDLIVLEASGNSFQIVRTLASVDRQALVLESGQMGKLKEAHANNDKISAVRIGKAYLAGTAKTVWVPDAKTQERRDWFHRPPQSRQTHHPDCATVSGPISATNGVRLGKGTPAGQGQGCCGTTAPTPELVSPPMAGYRRHALGTASCG